MTLSSHAITASVDHGSPHAQCANGHDDPTGNAEPFTMHADGTGATRLTVTPANDVQPAWFR